MRRSAAFALKLLVASCSSSGKGSDAAPGEPERVPAVESPIEAATGAPVTTAVARPPSCPPDEIHGRFIEAESAMNQPMFVIEVSTPSIDRCHLNGYPSVAAAEPDGTQVPTANQRGGGYVMDDPGPRDVEFSGDDRVYFGFETASVCSDNREPTIYDHIAVVLPSDDTTFVVPVRFPLCNHRSMLVSAITDDWRTLSCCFSNG